MRGVMSLDDDWFVVSMGSLHSASYSITIAPRASSQLDSPATLPTVTAVSGHAHSGYLVRTVISLLTN